MIDIDLNISILLKEYSFLERFSEAAQLGFETVEFYWEKDLDPKAVSDRVQISGLNVAAFNLDAGDLSTGDRGLLNDPVRHQRMRENVPVAIELAKSIGCKKLTALAGNLRPEEDREKQIDRMRENLLWICGEAEKAGITIMVEAVNAFDNKFYPFTDTDSTIEFLDSVGTSNLGYLYDIYHMYRMEGNIVSTLTKYVDRIEHIQIADSPGRNHPGTGEIDYDQILKTIEECGYKGSVGLEFIAMGSTEASLEWLPREHRRKLDTGSYKFGKVN